MFCSLLHRVLRAFTSSFAHFYKSAQKRDVMTARAKCRHAQSQLDVCVSWTTPVKVTSCPWWIVGLRMLCRVQQQQRLYPGSNLSNRSCGIPSKYCKRLHVYWYSGFSWALYAVYSTVKSYGAAWSSMAIKRIDSRCPGSPNEQMCRSKSHELKTVFAAISTFVKVPKTFKD